MKDVTWQGQLENIIEAVVAGVVVLDKDGRFVYVNAEAEKMLGLTRSDIIGRTYKDMALRIITTDGELVPAKDLPYARIMATGGPLHDVELTIERPDGVRVMVSISVTPFHDDKGTLKGMVASLIDITEQKRAEGALVESEARLQAILDNTTAIIYIKDTEGRYLLVNCHQVGLLHMTKEELLGKTDYDIFPKQRAELLRANDRRVIATGELLEFEEEIPLEGGVRTYVSIKFPLRDTKGAIYGVCGISTDITERKRAEEELKRAYDELEARIEERTAELMTANTLLKQEIRERERAAKEIRESRRQVIDILESITDGFFALDNEWRFTYVNYKATQLLGRRKEELLFRNIWEAFPEAVGTKFYQEFNRAKEEMVPVSFEEFYVPLNKRFEVHVYPYRHGLSGYFSDVTERKRVEEQIIFQASLLDQVRNAVIATDVEGRIIYWNKYAETLYQWKAEEAIGKTVLETITPPSGREIGEEIIKGMSTSGQWEGEFIVQRKDGSTFPAHVVDAAIKDAQGNIVGFVGLSVDTTERKKAEEELQFKSLLLDNAMDSIFVRDLEGRTLYVNEAAYKTRGYTREELMSLTFQELDTPEYAKLTKDSRVLEENRQRHIGVRSHQERRDRYARRNTRAHRRVWGQ